MLDQAQTFLDLLKKHVDAGADVHTAFGRAIDDDPEAYGQYLKRQKDSTIDGGDHDGRGTVQESDAGAGNNGSM